jgi:predicted phage-related endonuclease
MARGKLWEKVVGEMLVAELQDRGYRAEVVATNQRYVDTDLPYLAAEIDYELRLDDSPEIVNCELKTVSPFAASKWPASDVEDRAPVGYTAQVMHGLGVTRRSFGIMAALFGADELRVYPVHADADIISGMREQCVFFKEHYWDPRMAPPPVSALDCDKLFKLGNGERLIADEALIEAALRLRALNASIDAAEAEFAQLEYQVKRALGQCESLVIGGDNAITWKPRKFSHLDVTAFKEAEPKLYRQFVREGTTRAFSILKGWRAG